jgi:hypothetical protein
VTLEDPVDLNAKSQTESTDAAHSTATTRNKENSHRWLNSTSKFANEMASFWGLTVERFVGSGQNKRTTEAGVENDVVLALIDDGVDMFGTNDTAQILEGKSFDFHDGKVRPAYSSAKGHGTTMAKMILSVCPMVKVYPIRLKTSEDAEGKNMNIDASYAAQVCV